MSTWNKLRQTSKGCEVGQVASRKLRGAILWPWLTMVLLVANLQCQSESNPLSEQYFFCITQVAAQPAAIERGGRPATSSGAHCQHPQTGHRAQAGTRRTVYRPNLDARDIC